MIAMQKALALLLILLALAGVCYGQEAMLPVGADEVDALLLTGTGVLYLPGADMDDAVARFASEHGLAVRLAETVSDQARETLLAYLGRKGTAFANVSGDYALADEMQRQGSVASALVFVNHGTVVGMQIGLPKNDYQAFASACMEYFAVLNTQPCPDHC